MLISRKNKKEVFTIQSSNKLDFNKLNFIQVILQKDVLIIKINDFLDQMITISKTLQNDYFSSKTLSEEVKYKFNKNGNFHIYDLLTDIQTKHEIWVNASKEYMSLMINNFTFSNFEEFLFFSHFLKEFETFSKSETKVLESRLNTFSKTVITTSKPLGHDKYKR